MALDPRGLLAKADKALLNANSGFGFFGGRTEKIERAVEMYREAANSFRLQKDGAEAAAIFEKMADIQEKQLGDTEDSTQSLVEASKCYRKTDPESAARCLSAVIHQYTLKGNFRRAATTQQTLAEIYETELSDNGKACAAYEIAAGWFEEDNAQALAQKLYLKTADLLALDGNYYRAIEFFEKVARQAINNELSKYSVKDYLFRAGICQLASGDTIGAQASIEKYATEIDPSFASQREYQLLLDLCQCIQDGDPEAFSDKVYQFDQLSKLSTWKTSILLRVKKTIQEEEVDFA